MTTYLALHVVCGLVALGYQTGWQAEPNKPTGWVALVILLSGPFSLGCVLGDRKKH